MSNGPEPPAENPPAEEGFTNIVERFTGIVKKFKIKNAEVVADHCAKGNLEDLEDVESRMREMGVHPSLVSQLVNFWSDEIQHPIPKRLQQKMAREAGTKAKEVEEDADKIYTVDSDSGIIRLAKRDEKATTLDEAKELQKIIKKDLAEDRKRVKQEAEAETGEPSFVVGADGEWTLNPKGRIGFGEFAVFQMYQDSLKKGSPIDPIEELARREEASVRLREAMGGRGGDTEMTTIDKLQKLGILKPSEGGNLTDVLNQLDTIGLLRKPSDEGRGTELNMLDKLSALGMLVKPGEGESVTSQTIHALEGELKELKEALQKQELDAVKTLVSNLSNQLTDLRTTMTNQGRLEGRYGLMEKAIGAVDSQISGFRTDAKPLIEMIASGGGPGAHKKSPEERSKLAKSVKEAVALESEARQLEEELMLGK
ncbi:hypothetical protein LCGC14_0262940 [marine sediment metagenome]|uniref:Uncharacterized protein n=1 Tax=marine sediment metagenome TaxID=412755 RepID=A0A0F9U1A8_9ZZZZ